MFRLIKKSSIYKLGRAIFNFSWLWIFFKKNGRVIFDSRRKIVQQKIIQLHCDSSGRAIDKLCLSIKPQKINFEFESELFSALMPKLDFIVSNLNQFGYCLLPNVLSAGLCKRVVNYALTTPCYPRPDKDAVSLPEPSVLVEPFRSARYDFSRDVHLIMKNADLQKIMTDRFLLEIAQRYLGSRPFLDPLELWWYVPYEKRDREWAEEYHFDMDTLKWVKFFFNFEAVTYENGPHCFIEGSHRSGDVPSSFLDKGYARLTDRQVFEKYPKDREKIFIAPAGSLLIEDTRGLHKGLTPTNGRRLLFSVQYSNALLNGRYPMDKNSSDEIKESMMHIYEKYPSIFSAYL
jgi:hypothetical protein